jgi:uncharacterized membrane protein YhaH (DUF805 family)
MAKFLAAVLRGFKNFFNFSGRASTREYWYFILAAIIVGNIVAFASSDPNHLVIARYVFLLPIISVGVRRLHDTGHRGWWLLFPFVNLFLLCSKADDGINKYGPPSPPLG